MYEIISSLAHTLEQQQHILAFDWSTSFFVWIYDGKRVWDTLFLPTIDKYADMQFAISSVCSCSSKSRTEVLLYDSAKRDFLTCKLGTINVVYFMKLKCIWRVVLQLLLCWSIRIPTNKITTQQTQFSVHFFIALFHSSSWTLNIFQIINKYRKSLGYECCIHYLKGVHKSVCLK